MFVSRKRIKFTAILGLFFLAEFFTPFIFSHFFFNIERSLVEENKLIDTRNYNQSVM